MNKALVVDDDTLTATLLSELIKNFTVESCSASSGSQALEILEADQGINILFVDMEMPSMNGKEFIAQVRLIHGKEKHYIIAMSAGGTAKSALKRLNGLGVSMFLSKPLHPEVVMLNLRLCNMNLEGVLNG